MDTSVKTGPCIPLTLSVLALEPESKTPWWARRLNYSHIVILVGGYVWSQSIRGVGHCYEAETYLSGLEDERGYVEVRMAIENPDHLGFVQACNEIDNKKGQPIRTVLRHLRLWPRPAWNCTSPVRALLRSQGIEVNGETPGDIIEELGWVEPDAD